MTTLNFALTRTVGARARGRRRDPRHAARPRRQRLALARAGARPRARGSLRRDSRRHDARPRRPRSQLSDRTRVVAYPWASNAVGTLVDVARVAELAHEAGALAWVDAVHYGPHGPIDVAAAGIDVLLCSPYKFFGPHLGLGFARAELLERWRPYKVRPGLRRAARAPLRDRDARRTSSWPGSSRRCGTSSRSAGTRSSPRAGARRALPRRPAGDVRAVRPADDGRPRADLRLQRRRADPARGGHAARATAATRSGRGTTTRSR